MNLASLGGRHVQKTLLHVGRPLKLVHVGESVVAQTVGGATAVVGVDVVLVVSEVLEHLHEVHAVDSLDLVQLHPVEELLLVEGTVVHVSRHGGGLLIHEKRAKRTRIKTKVRSILETA